MKKSKTKRENDTIAIKTKEEKGAREVYIDLTKNRIEVSVMLLSYEKPLFLIKDKPTAKREKLVFDFKKRRVRLFATDEKGKEIGKADITNKDLRLFEFDPIVSLVCFSKPVYTKLYEIFEKKSESKAALSDFETPLECFVLMVIFPGFDNLFYNSLPYKGSKNNIEKTFLKRAKKLSDKKAVPALYKKMRIPKNKNAEEFFISHPVLFIYSNEIEKIGAITPVSEDFYRVISSKDTCVFLLLKLLHKYPHIIKPLKILSKSQGRYFSELLIDNVAWIHPLLSYNSLSPFYKRELMKKLKETTFTDSEELSYSIGKTGDDYSLPAGVLLQIEPASNLFKNVTIDGFSFEYIKNTLQYTDLRKNFLNELMFFDFSNNAIFAVQKDGNYLAAIEVDIKSESVKQRETTEHTDIKEDEKLFSAYLKWKDEKGLE